MVVVPVAGSQNRGKSTVTVEASARLPLISPPPQRREPQANTTRTPDNQGYRRRLFASLTLLEVMRIRVTLPCIAYGDAKSNEAQPNGAH